MVRSASSPTSTCGSWSTGKASPASPYARSRDCSRFSPFRPEIVLVNVDTLASFAAALASFFEQVPVAHVEAGLRTFHRYDPFPEEMSRRLTARLASLHFAPTARAKENLLREGVPAEEIFVVGNTVIDALLSQVDPGFTFADPLLRDIDFARERVLLVTAHRRENWGAPLERIYRALVQVAEIYPDVRIVVALHKNPLIRRAARDILSGRSRIHLIEPPAYRSFVNLMARCTLILTDSGGIQEEAPALGKPVLVLRETTERPEGLEAGTCLKVGTGTERIVGAVRRLLDDAAAYEQMRRGQSHGDGQAARRIVEILWAKLRQGGTRIWSGPLAGLRRERSNRPAAVAMVLSREGMAAAGMKSRSRVARQASQPTHGMRGGPLLTNKVPRLAILCLMCLVLASSLSPLGRRGRARFLRCWCPNRVLRRTTLSGDDVADRGAADRIVPVRSRRRDGGIFRGERGSALHRARTVRRRYGGGTEGRRTSVGPPDGSAHRRTGLERHVSPRPERSGMARR